MATLVDSHTTESAAPYGMETTSWSAQTFTTSEAYDITEVQVKLYRNASVTGTVTLSIRATSGNLPTGADLVSTTKAATDITTSSPGEYYTFTFASAYTLTSGTVYAIVIRVSDGSGAAKLSWRGENPGAGTYSSGRQCYSTTSGSSWTGTTGDYTFKTYKATIPLDKTYSRSLVAIGNNEVWYESTAGTLAEITDANGDLDCGNPLEAIEAYQKIFIANKSNKKVIDFINTKISTADAGANPTTFGMTLTGGTSGATMIVDYADAVTDDASANVYGKRTSTVTFTSGETVTGTNGNDDAVSFVLSANEDAPPHWYDYTVYGNDTTTYGTMLSNPTLICLYRGRIVTAGDNDMPHAWQMSKVGNPWKVLYDYSGDGDLSGLSYANNQVGELGDIITALISYKDDLLIFGCANSIWVLIGDPFSGGQLAEVTNKTGIWGSRAWCISEDKTLFFLGNDGIYKMPIGETTTMPINISRAKLPNLMSDLDLDKSLHRVTLAYDPIENGIIISKTLSDGGTNTNYFYSLLTTGFFPETYPTSCGVFSAYFYPATDETYKKFLVGCDDGYVREFDAATKNDATTSSTSAINSYCTIIQKICDDEFTEAMLRKFCATVSGGASSGTFSDTDAVSWALYTGDDAETVLEDIMDAATAFVSGTWSTTGKQNTVRPRVRGFYIGLKLYNSTASQTWSIEKVFGGYIAKGVK